MATIADLLTRLEGDAIALTEPAKEASPDAYAAGWMLLADRTQHAIDQLPLGGRPERVGAGLRALLKPLITGPRRGLPADNGPVAELVELAETMGAISDVLAGTLREWPRPEYVGRESARLAAGLLAPVHLATRWSARRLEHDGVRANRSALVGLLDDLAAATESWALIPPANRGGVLGDFRVRAPSAPGLQGAMVAWADEALLVLSERHRTSSWAMQATAGNLALLGQAAYDVVEQAIKQGGLPEPARQASKALATSVTAWRAAATWPPYLRLGGKTSDLRVLTRDLQQHFASDPPRTVADTRNLLRLALPVAQAHAATMDRLARTHDLWIHGPSLGPSAGYIPGWEPEPWWSHQGLTLVRTAQIGHQALDKASAALAVDGQQSEPRSLPLGWPPIRDEVVRRPHHERGPVRSPVIGRGPTR